MRERFRVVTEKGKNYFIHKVLEEIRQQTTSHS